MRYILLLSIIALYSCSNMSEREKSYHVLHFVDVMQTYQITKSDCHVEVGSAGILLGENPDSGDVVVWGIASAVVYHYAEKHIPSSMLDLNLVLKFGTVSNNNKEGLRVGGYTC